MGLGSIASKLTGGGEAGVRPLSEQEKRIMNRMEQLSKGDPELGQMYFDFTKRALRGRADPYLEQQLARQEGLLREDIARRMGPLGDIASTAGIEATERQRQAANIARAEAARRDVAAGEGLISSRYGRLIGAGEAALRPYQMQRQMEAQYRPEGGGLLEMAGRAGIGYFTGGPTGAAVSALGGTGLLPMMMGGGPGKGGAGQIPIQKTRVPGGGGSFAVEGLGTF